MVFLSGQRRQMQQIFGNVSHELRTPLTIVQVYLQSVLKRETNLTPQREALKTAATEAESTIGLLQDLLDLARVDAGYLHIQIESLVLNDLVVEVAAMAIRYSDRMITLETKGKKIRV